VNERVELIVSGGFGPNALAALEELGIGRLELSGVRISDALREVGRRGEAGRRDRWTARRGRATRHHEE